MSTDYDDDTDWDTGLVSLNPPAPVPYGGHIHDADGEPE